MIFPDWGGTGTQTAAEDLPLYTEWAVDWERNAFALRNGRPYTVSGDEALRIWVRCALHPDSRRFLYSAHSADYGNQLAEYMTRSGDRDILEALLRRELQETLLVSPYIRQVDGFTFARKGQQMTVGFRVQTVYDGFTTETEVNIP